MRGPVSRPPSTIVASTGFHEKTMLSFLGMENSLFAHIRCFVGLTAGIGNGPNAWGRFLVESGCGSASLSKGLPIAG